MNSFRRRVGGGHAPVYDVLNAASDCKPKQRVDRQTEYGLETMGSMDAANSTVVGGSGCDSCGWQRCGPRDRVPRPPQLRLYRAAGACSRSPQAAAPLAGGKLHGMVKSGNIPLPGVTITAQNTLTGKKYSTTTDITGAWSLTLPQNGRYVVRTQFAAFAVGVAGSASERNRATIRR